MKRTADPSEVNALLNDPAIRPTIGGHGFLDAASLLADDRNYCVICDDGGALFRWSGPGIYEGHSFFRVRGKQAIHLGRNVLQCMMWADMIYGLTPKELRHVRWFNRKLGFQSKGMMMTPDGECELFEMRF